MKKKLNEIQITWLGQSFFKIMTSSGRVIFIDPWKDFPPGNILFPKKYSLGKPDVIMITHGHFDHMGDTLDLVKKYPKTKVVSGFEIMLYLMEQGVSQENLLSMNKGGTINFDGIKITMTNAFHSGGIGPFSSKHLVYGGEPAGYIIRLENGVIIYHAGDTSLFSDMKLIHQFYKPDVAFLPIGDVYTMGPKEAAHAVSFIKPKIAVPMHYAGTFELPGDPKEFLKLVKKINKNTQVFIPDPGQAIDV